MFKKIMSETHSLAWTLGGTGLVLITLSGTVRTYGIIISVASLAVHVIGFLLSGDE